MPTEQVVSGKHQGRPHTFAPVAPGVLLTNQAFNLLGQGLDLLVVHDEWAIFNAFKSGFRHGQLGVVVGRGGRNIPAVREKDSPEADFLLGWIDKHRAIVLMKNGVAGSTTA